LPLEGVSSSSINEPPPRTRNKTSKSTTRSLSPKEPYLWHGSKIVASMRRSSMTYFEDWPTPIHTLILGTQHKNQGIGQSYAHEQNTFWWIAGDCLQFRRSKGISDKTNIEFALCRHLRYDNVLTYEEQLLRLISKGFALCDVLASDKTPNDIRGVCQSHPSIRRIVLATGKAGCSAFISKTRTGGRKIPQKVKLFLFLDLISNLRRHFPIMSIDETSISLHHKKENSESLNVYSHFQRPRQLQRTGVKPWITQKNETTGKNIASSVHYKICKT